MLVTFAAWLRQRRSLYMSNGKKWDPDYWFLAIGEVVKVKLREADQEESIPQNQLLKERFWEWRKQNQPPANIPVDLSGPGNTDAWGMPDTELTDAYTFNNEVTVLIDGKDFMTALYEELSELEAGGFALIAGWEFWQYRSLTHRVYKDSPGDDPTFLPAVLKTADDKGVKVRVLAFEKGPPGCKERTGNFIEAVNKIRKNSAFLAAPTNFAMSHHQKEVLLSGTSFGLSRAYIGGMDLAIHRWDDSKHEAEGSEWGPPAEGKLVSRTRRAGNYGWHDIQVVVRGDALIQLWANFAERWDDARKERKEKKVGVDYRTPPSVSSQPAPLPLPVGRAGVAAEDLLPCPVPEWAKTGWNNRAKDIGQQYVQVLRTVGPASSKERGRDRFMRDGERTVLCGLKKAIEKAECYIYIEEQFLWDCELADFIAKKMNEKNSKLHLIIVMTAGCELPVEFGQYGFFLRDAFFRKILSIDRMTWGPHEEGRVEPVEPDVEFGQNTRIYPYGLFQTEKHGSVVTRKRQEIYVHSKLIIIDDRYVAVGSANVDARSMHIETELTLGIVDGKTVTSRLDGNTAIVCRFAKELRETLWKEHSGVDLSNQDPIEALTQFPGVGGSGWPNNSIEARQQQKHHLRCYINNPGANLSRPWMRRLIDRYDRTWLGE
jgi:phosphatidylserine/phosphatidylglycerophosphate/cardiolipin synthase-like enzyme